MSARGVKKQREKPTFREVSMHVIDEPYQPARIAMDENSLNELAQSIADVGLIQPLILVKRGDRFEIIAGHRRFLACKIAPLVMIPALIFTDKIAALEAMRLHENLHREDLTAAEEAIYFVELNEKFGLNEEQLCKLVKKSPDYIADRIRLTKGDPAVFDAVKERYIKFSVGRELNKITDEKYRRMYLQSAIDCDPLARTVMAWVSDWRKNAQPIPDITAAAAGDVAAPEATVVITGCEVCGGNLDPWNLVYMRIHKHERDAILKAAHNAPEE